MKYKERSDSVKPGRVEFPPFCMGPERPWPEPPMGSPDPAIRLSQFEPDLADLHVGLLFDFNVDALAAGGWKRVLRRG